MSSDFPFQHLALFKIWQVQNQKGVEMLVYKYEKLKILPTFQEKAKRQW